MSSRCVVVYKHTAKLAIVNIGKETLVTGDKALVYYRDELVDVPIVIDERLLGCFRIDSKQNAKGTSIGIV